MLYISVTIKFTIKLALKTQANQTRDQIIIFFHFLIFSSSHPLTANICHPITIQKTARIQRIVESLLVHFCTLVAKPSFTLVLEPSTKVELVKHLFKLSTMPLPVI
jgi:hypothetical protein